MLSKFLNLNLRFLNRSLPLKKLFYQKVNHINNIIYRKVNDGDSNNYQKVSFLITTKNYSYRMVSFSITKFKILSYSDFSIKPQFNPYQYSKINLSLNFSRFFSVRDLRFSDLTVRDVGDRVNTFKKNPRGVKIC